MGKKVLKTIVGVCIMTLVFWVWATISLVTMIWFIIGTAIGISAGIRLEGNVFPKIRTLWNALQRILSEGQQEPAEPQTATSYQKNAVNVNKEVNKEEHVPVSEIITVSEQSESSVEYEKDGAEQVLPNVEVRPVDLIPDDPEIPATFNIYDCCLPKESTGLPTEEKEEKAKEMEFNALSSVAPDNLPKDVKEGNGAVVKSKEVYTSLDDMLQQVS